MTKSYSKIWNAELKKRCSIEHMEFNLFRTPKGVFRLAWQPRIRISIK
jgi:hypothetical protein